MPNNAKITLIGNLTKDPQTRNVGERTVTSFTVAVNTLAKGDDGKYTSNFYDVSVWGKSGEYLKDKLQKGSQVWVNGDFLMDEYKAKDGTVRQMLRVNGTDVRGLSRLKDGSGSSATAKSDADELPF